MAQYNRVAHFFPSVVLPGGIPNIPWRLRDDHSDANQNFTMNADMAILTDNFGRVIGGGVVVNFEDWFDMGPTGENEIRIPFLYTGVDEGPEISLIRPLLALEVGDNLKFIFYDADDNHIFTIDLTFSDVDGVYEPEGVQSGSGTFFSYHREVSWRGTSPATFSPPPGGSLPADNFPMDFTTVDIYRQIGGSGPFESILGKPDLGTVLSGGFDFWCRVDDANLDPGAIEINPAGQAERTPVVVQRLLAREDPRFLRGGVVRYEGQGYDITDVRIENREMAISMQRDVQ